MTVRIGESDRFFHVPYGPPNHDGTPHLSFVDLKAHPEWVPVIPACLGWPETRDILQTINAPESPLMTLAAHQSFASPEQPEFKAVLTSFLTICYADLERNRKQTLGDLAACLQEGMSDFLQAASSDLQRDLFLHVLLEIQPTVFHQKALEGWSLTLFIAAYGADLYDSRQTWGICMQALEQALPKPIR